MLLKDTILGGKSIFLTSLSFLSRRVTCRTKAKSVVYFPSLPSFLAFSPVGDFIDAKEIKDVNNLNLWYKVNGVTKQEGSTSDMIFKIPELIAYVSNIMTLEKGDLIITGSCILLLLSKCAVV